jgi:hypothetical protein
MSTRRRRATVPLPPLSDQAAVDVLAFLYDALETFEAHYGAQIRRHYQDHAYEAMVRHRLDEGSDAGDEPF